MFTIITEYSNVINCSRTSNFDLQHNTEDEILQIINSIEVSKAAVVDTFSGGVLKSGTKVLVQPVKPSLACCVIY